MLGRKTIHKLQTGVITSTSPRVEKPIYNNDISLLTILFPCLFLILHYFVHIAFLSGNRHSERQAAKAQHMR